MLSQRTEASQVFANPEGDFTEESYAMPRWTRKSGRMLSIDTGLTKNGDGTFSPKATEVAMKFSGGGKGPLAVIAKDGRTMSVQWPTALPTPVVEGDTATYRGVMPDVDLTVQARYGGFSHVLVVHNAKAAANPELQKISYGLAAQGLKISATSGQLSAVNPAGQEVFAAPKPVMWDSGKPGDGLLRNAPADAPATTPTSDHTGPGLGARRSVLGVELKDDTLSLTPDQDLLTGEDTAYPVFIDPTYEASGTKHSWAIAYKKYPDESYFNGAGFNGGTTTARAGYENHTSGLARSYFRMNTKNLQDKRRVISSSQFRIKNTWSWSCQARKIELWHTQYLKSSMTWNNQPGKLSTLDSLSVAKGYDSSCPAGNLAFDTTSAAKQSQAGTWNTITLALKSTSETDVYGWKKFDSKTAVLSTRYNTVPNWPSGLDTYPVSTNNQYGCGDKAPYQYIGNLTEFYLQAKVSDPDGGTVKAKFHLWATGHHPNSDPDGVMIVDTTVSVSSGSVAKAKVTKAQLLPHLATANGNFSWKVQANDGSLYSDWNPTAGAPGCRFVFDPNRPSAPPAVTSAQFPDGSDGWPYNTSPVRTEGTFTLSNGGADDVTKYEYWTTWDSTRRTATPSSTGGSVSIKLTPNTTGANKIYVKSYDNAGNSSDTGIYLFYANSPKNPDRAGDINGDNAPDLWGVDGTGTLRRFYGAGDGTVTEAYKTASDFNWTGALITHRGEWTDDAYEDLIALRKEQTDTEHRLWIYPNNGYGFTCTNCTNGQQRHELQVYDPNNNHWKNGAKQILAIGDVDGGVDFDGDGIDEIPAYPDLLVNDGEFLWLYFGERDYRLDSYREPVLLAGPDDPIASGDSTVGQVTLGAPGDWNGDGLADLVVRYDRPDVGGLYVFHGGQDTFGDYDISLEQRTAIGGNWSSDAVPMFALTPDADNTGNPLDFWATTPGSGQLRFLGNHEADTGHTTFKTASTAFAEYLAVS